MLIVLSVLHEAFPALDPGRCDRLDCYSGRRCFRNNIRRIAVLTRSAARQMTFFFASAVSSSTLHPSQRPSTSALCSPSSGARVTSVGESDMRTGLPGIGYRPRVGCSRSTIMPRCTSEGSVITSPESRTAPQGIPAAPRVSITSCFVRFSVHPSTSASSSSLRATRPIRSASVGSSPISGRPRIFEKVFHISRVAQWMRSEEHTSELQSLTNLVCRLLLEKKKKKTHQTHKPRHVTIYVHRRYR